MKKGICAVVVTYNPDRTLKENLLKLKEQVSKIIIVDNGSMNDVSIIVKDIENCIVIKNNMNLGIANALNIGVNYIQNSCEWILTLDQDSKISSNMINLMLDEYNNRQDKNEIMIIAANSVEKNKKIYEKKNKSELVLTEITSGNLVNVKIFEKIGLFREELFIDLVDHEFCLRVNSKGFKILKVRNAILWHSLGNTKEYNFLGKKITSSNHSALRRYYMSRNRIIIWKEYKSKYPEWVDKDKKLFLNEFVRILLFEKQKIDKINKIIIGVLDGKKGIVGKYKG